MLDYINETKYCHILTIEDPIEFVHESKKCLVNQREVHRDTLGFDEALRSALREDPDIIMVGEMQYDQRSWRQSWCAAFQTPDALFRRQLAPVEWSPDPAFHPP
jgi:Tfp pilus assembly pilus retraction ATPase PilT